MRIESENRICETRSVFRCKKSPFRIDRTLFCVGLLSACLWQSGCKDREKIKVYRVSKGAQESQPPQGPVPGGPGMRDMPPMSVPMPPSAPEGGPSPVTDTAPPDWKAQPLSSMRQASYLVEGENGATADISLVALGGPAGGVLDNVNRWLGQLGRPAITAEELSQMAQQVASPLGVVTLVDLEGLPQGADAAKDGRIVAGIVAGGSGTFFFKMRGNSALAESQKPAFVRWIGTVRSAGEEPGPSRP